MNELRCANRYDVSNAAYEWTATPKKRLRVRKHVQHVGASCTWIWEWIWWIIRICFIENVWFLTSMWPFAFSFCWLRKFIIWDCRLATDMEILPVRRLQFGVLHSELYISSYDPSFCAEIYRVNLTVQFAATPWHFMIKFKNVNSYFFFVDWKMSCEAPTIKIHHRLWNCTWWCRSAGLSLPKVHEHVWIELMFDDFYVNDGTRTPNLK